MAETAALSWTEFVLEVKVSTILEKLYGVGKEAAMDILAASTMSVQGTHIVEALYCAQLSCVRASRPRESGKSMVATERIMRSSY